MIFFCMLHDFVKYTTHPQVMDRLSCELGTSWRRRELVWANGCNNVLERLERCIDRWNNCASPSESKRINTEWHLTRSENHEKKVSKLTRIWIWSHIQNFYMFFFREITKFQVNLEQLAQSQYSPSSLKDSAATHHSQVSGRIDET